MKKFKSLLCITIIGFLFVISTLINYSNKYIVNQNITPVATSYAYCDFLVTEQSSFSSSITLYI